MLSKMLNILKTCIMSPRNLLFSNVKRLKSFSSFSLGFVFNVINLFVARRCTLSSSLIFYLQLIYQKCTEYSRWDLNSQLSYYFQRLLLKVSHCDRKHQVNFFSLRRHTALYITLHWFRLSQIFSFSYYSQWLTLDNVHRFIRSFPQVHDFAFA